MQIEKYKSPNIPPYMEIIEAIKNNILSGRWAPGQKIPPIRHMAEQFTVNPNTVQRAITELKRDGFVIRERGSGLYVTTDVSFISNRREAQAQKLVDKLQVQLRELGFSTSEIQSWLKPKL